VTALEFLTFRLLFLKKMCTAPDSMPFFLSVDEAALSNAQTLCVLLQFSGVSEQTDGSFLL
jgi:hypothetical protein